MNAAQQLIYVCGQGMGHELQQFFRSDEARHLDGDDFYNAAEHCLTTGRVDNLEMLLTLMRIDPIHQHHMPRIAEFMVEKCHIHLIHLMTADEYAQGQHASDDIAACVENSFGDRGVNAFEVMTRLLPLADNDLLCSAMVEAVYITCAPQTYGQTLVRQSNQCIDLLFEHLGPDAFDWIDADYLSIIEHATLEQSHFGVRRRTSKDRKALEQAVDISSTVAGAKKKL